MVSIHSTPKTSHTFGINIFFLQLASYLSWVTIVKPSDDAFAINHESATDKNSSLAGSLNTLSGAYTQLAISANFSCVFSSSIGKK